MSNDSWLSELNDALPIAIGVACIHTRDMLYVNQEYLRILRVTREEALARKAGFSFARPEEYRALISLMGSDGIVRDHELELVRSDFSHVWVAATVQRATFHDGRPVIVGSFYDVNERGRVAAVRATEAAAAAEMARFPDMNPGPVLRLDLDGQVLLANKAAREAFRKKSLIGGSWFELCPGMSVRRWADILRSDGHTPHEAEIAGTWIHFSHRRAGELVFVYGADIQARKEAERELSYQTKKISVMAQFPEMNPGPVLRLDGQARVLLANAAARELFKDAPERNWLVMCPGMDDALWTRIKSATSTVNHSASVAGRDFVFTHRRSPEDGLIFVYGADVTQQHAAERALKDAEKMAMLGTLAAGIAHELNNPAAAAKRAAEQLRTSFAAVEEAALELRKMRLSPESEQALVGLDELAQARARTPPPLGPIERSDREADVEDWLDDQGAEEAWELAPALVGMGLCRDELAEHASAFSSDQLVTVFSWLGRVFPVYSLTFEIQNAAGRISEIVTALKSYSFLGQAPVQETDLREGLDNTLIILKNKTKRGVTVVREYAQDLPGVPAYGSELNQVWTNLLDNAIDAMNGEGVITIRTRRDGGHAVVEIEDDGPGIPEKIAKRIFEPFYTTKAPGKGTGLGLATSQSIIEKKHGGTISVSSRPGCTIFKVMLPLEHSSPPSDKSNEEQRAT